MAGAQRRRPGSSARPQKRSSEAEIVSEKPRFPVQKYIVAIFIASVVLLLVWKSLLSATFVSLKAGDVSYKHLLQEVTSPGIVKDSTHRNLDGIVLAYVTPWNSKGYDMAKKYRAKFTHVSPVWYQLKRNEKSLSLSGRHDVDQSWISEVRKQGSPMILPRVVLEGWPLQNMLVKAQEKQEAINLIVDECKNMRYDGVVLEAWNAWASYRILENRSLRHKALEFVRDLGWALRSSSMQLVLVIPPDRGGTNLVEFKRNDMEFLKDSVDGFSLMTYDFSSAYQPGPNAPLSWVRSCINSLNPEKKPPTASKLLVGINFYGNDFLLPQGGGAIVGDQFLNLLQQYKPELKWDAGNQEHYFDYNLQQQKHRVYYPTPASLSLRLNETRATGVGVSIWEIGQGLEIFFNLL